MEHQLVIFELQNELYGLDIQAVEGIIKMQAITSLPHTPSFIEGVTNLRGAVVPVINLRSRFGLNGAEAGSAARIVIINVDGMKAGLMVDAVSQVVRISDEVLEAPPQISITERSAFIKSIAHLNDRLVILLDLNKVLTAEEKERLAAL